MNSTCLNDQFKNPIINERSVGQTSMVNIEVTNAEDISKKFNLNQQQDLVFKEFVNSLGSEIDCIAKRIYMYGEGGTGKSQVIKTIIEYFFKNSTSFITGCSRE